MAYTQNNSDITSAWTTVTGGDTKTYQGPVAAELNSVSDSPFQCEDAYGVYPSLRAKKRAELERQGRI